MMEFSASVESELISRALAANATPESRAINVASHKAGHRDYLDSVDSFSHDFPLDPSC